MKTLITLVSLLTINSVGVAQSDKYQKAMENAVATYDTARSAPAIQSLIGQFSRIAQAEIAREKVLSHEARNPAEENSRGDERGRAPGSLAWHGSAGARGARANGRRQPAHQMRRSAVPTE